MMPLMMSLVTRRMMKKGQSKKLFYGRLYLNLFLGNCPPTPPLSQHQYLLLTQGKMLAQGRGRWAVSQKCIMIHNSSQINSRALLSFSWKITPEPIELTHANLPGCSPYLSFKKFIGRENLIRNQSIFPLVVISSHNLFS